MFYSLLADFWILYRSWYQFIVSVKAVVQERRPFSISSERIVPLLHCQQVINRCVAVVWMLFECFFMFGDRVRPIHQIKLWSQLLNTSLPSSHQLKKEHTDDPIDKINAGNVSINYWYVETCIYGALLFFSLRPKLLVLCFGLGTKPTRSQLGNHFKPKLLLWNTRFFFFDRITARDCPEVLF